MVLASPVYYSTLPGQVLSLMSRLQPWHAAKFFLNRPLMLREKKAAVILTAGGKGNQAQAFHHLRALFRMLNARGFEEHWISSPNTDTIPADLDTLCAIGSTIGADIPFCVVGGCAKTLGIGDRITPMDYKPSCTILLARDGQGISTPQAYRALDDLYGDRLTEDFGDFAGFLASAAAGDAIPAHMCNTFENVILPQHPEAAALRERILAGGGQALMSGSGPAVFGLFTDPEKARAVYDAMQADGIESHLCRAVSRI